MAQNEATKVAILVCGINGAGKSTYINGVIRPALDQQGMEYVYINADDWQKKQFASFQNETDEHAKAAQVWANTERARCIREGQSFVTETVFSHPSKLEVIEEAQSAGLQVHLFHIHVDNADTVLHRINNRIKEGGHSVPADKVLSRYQRILPIIKEAALKADRAYLLDNSIAGDSHRVVMKLEHGKITKLFSEPPQWIQNSYAEQLNEWRSEVYGSMPSNTEYRLHQFAALAQQYSETKDPNLLQESEELRQAIIGDLANLKDSQRYDDVQILIKTDVHKYGLNMALYATNYTQDKHHGPSM